jgi:hypothetical protein
MDLEAGRPLSRGVILERQPRCRPKASVGCFLSGAPMDSSSSRGWLSQQLTSGVEEGRGSVTVRCLVEALPQGRVEKLFKQVVVSRRLDNSNGWRARSHLALFLWKTFLLITHRSLKSGRNRKILLS